MEFTFERNLEHSAASQISMQPVVAPTKNFRMVCCAAHLLTYLLKPKQTVCRHWLRGLCMKGTSCGFLHQFEAARMPVCRFFSKYGECKVRRALLMRDLKAVQEPDCPFKHSSEDIKVHILSSVRQVSFTHI